MFTTKIPHTHLKYMLTLGAPMRPHLGPTFRIPYLYQKNPKGNVVCGWQLIHRLYRRRISKYKPAPLPEPHIIKACTGHGGKGPCILKIRIDMNSGIPLVPILWAVTTHCPGVAKNSVRGVKCLRFYHVIRTQYFYKACECCYSRCGRKRLQEMDSHKPATNKN